MRLGDAAEGRALRGGGPGAQQCFTAMLLLAGAAMPIWYAPYPTFKPRFCLRSNFANHNKLKRQAMKVIASAMPVDEIAGLAEIFKSIDADGSGTITADELSTALKNKGSLLKKVGHHCCFAIGVRGRCERGDCVSLLQRCSA